MSLETTLNHFLSDFMSQIPTESESFVVAQNLLHELAQLMETMHSARPEEWQAFLDELETPPSPLFYEVGKLVRTFYDQLKTIRSDIPERLGSIAEHDMEDASQRLQHVVAMTETAANTTLDLAEKTLNSLGERSGAYSEALEALKQALQAGELPPAAQAALQKAQAVLQAHQNQDDEYQAWLTEILVAQNYQDLTGQVIHKIVLLLQRLESELIGLVETFGKAYKRGEAQEAAQLKGPLHEEHEERQSQDKVDDLLASLGF